jgi:solute carrier family 25 oxoglutarate transporter 11
MPKTTAEVLQPFVCGGSAATFASCVIHPIDLAKVRMQIYGQLNPGAKVPGFPSVLKSIFNSEGLAGCYKGVDAAIGRQMVYGTARIGLHRSFSDKLVQMNGGEDVNFALKTMSGMASGAVAVCIGTPFDIALVRLQSDSMAAVEERRGYKHVFDVLLRIPREEGIGALYKGLGPNILRGMSMNVGMLSCYDQAKVGVASLTGDDPKKPGMATTLGASAVAGFTAALFSLPFDLIKSRLMAMKPGVDGTLPYSGVADCAVKIMKADGPAGFFAGFSAYYGRCAPHAMIILTSIESITTFYKKTFVNKKEFSFQDGLKQ